MLDKVCDQVDHTKPHTDLVRSRNHWRNTESVKKWVAAILWWDWILPWEQFQWLITNEQLRKILQENKLIWVNIRQKLKWYLRKLKSTTNRDEKLKLKQKIVNDLVLLFLLPELKQWKSYPKLTELQKLINKEFIDNEQLMVFIENNTPYSFVEQPIEIITHLDKTKKTDQKTWLVIESCNQIETVIRNSLWRNIAADIDFNEIHIAVIHYMKEIFMFDILHEIPDFPISFSNKDNLSAIIQKIARELRNAIAWKWVKWKIPKTKSWLAAWAYLKWLFAWGYLPRIRSQRALARSNQDEIFSKLDHENMFWIWEDIDLHTPKKKTKESIFDHDENEYKRARVYNFKYNGKIHIITIESRIKGLKSILTKLMADDNYNDVDTMLDMLWFRLILWKNIPEDAKKALLKKMSLLFWKNSYIFKNKGLFEDNIISNLKDHSPLTQQIDRKTRSSANYRDAKFAWFIRWSESSMEMQFFENSDDPNPKWEAHHSLIEAFRIMQWWCRITWFITYDQLMHTINHECFDVNNKSKSWLKFNDILNLSLKRWLVPYSIKHGEYKYVLFGFTGYERLLTGRYPNAEKIHISSSSQKTSSPLQNPDRWFSMDAKTKQDLNEVLANVSLPKFSQ